jgi:TatA/E family protein of Tat protein translocase
MLPNIGPIELIVILIIALIVIGPGRLPDVGAALGKSIKEFRKASSDITEAATVDTSPLPPAAAASQAPAPAAPIQEPPAPPPVVADPAAAPSASAPSTAPTPEPSQPVPTNPIIPAPIQVPPVDDDAAGRPPA